MAIANRAKGPPRAERPRAGVPPPPRPSSGRRRAGRPFPLPSAAPGGVTRRRLCPFVQLGRGHRSEGPPGWVIPPVRRRAGGRHVWRPPEIVRSLLVDDVVAGAAVEGVDAGAAVE